MSFLHRSAWIAVSASLALGCATEGHEVASAEGEARETDPHFFVQDLGSGYYRAFAVVLEAEGWSVTYEDGARTQRMLEEGDCAFPFGKIVCTSAGDGFESSEKLTEVRFERGRNHEWRAVLAGGSKVDGFEFVDDDLTIGEKLAEVDSLDTIPDMAFTMYSMDGDREVRLHREADGRYTSTVRWLFHDTESTAPVVLKTGLVCMTGAEGDITCTGHQDYADFIATQHKGEDNGWHVMAWGDAELGPVENWPHAERTDLVW